MIRSLRFGVTVIIIGLCGTPIAPVHASHSSSPFGVEFSDCVESIGVGLAPTANVVALTPPEFTPVGMGTPTSPIVVRTADCAGIAVDRDKAKPGAVVQIGAVIVPPDFSGDINLYTFWYYTTDAKLAHHLQDLGVDAQHVARIDYDLAPGETAIPNELDVTVRRPGEPRFSLAGAVVPSDVASGSFESIWWRKGFAGAVRIDTNVPVISISLAANLTLATDAASALGMLIGGSTLEFPLIQQFNMFPGANMGVTIAP